MNCVSLEKEKLGATMIQRQISKLISPLILVAAVLASFNVEAETYSFGCISAPTTDAACVSGENYLRMDVTSADAGSRAQFDFYFASGSTFGDIHEIYFDNGPLDRIVSNIGTTGVAYQTIVDGGTSPAQLPGGGSAPGGAFIAQVSLSADSTGGGLDGVDGGTNEHLYLQFSLLSGKTFNDVLFALSSGDLRVGLHVGALNDNDASRSFVNVTPIPEPEIYAMMGLGLGLMGFVARRRKQQAAA